MNERNITEKIFINDQDIDFLAYVKNEYEFPFPIPRKIF